MIERGRTEERSIVSKNSLSFVPAIYCQICSSCCHSNSHYASFQIVEFIFRNWYLYHCKQWFTNIIKKIYIIKSEMCKLRSKILQSAFHLCLLSLTNFNLSLIECTGLHFSLIYTLVWFRFLYTFQFKFQCLISASVWHLAVIYTPVWFHFLISSFLISLSDSLI